MAGGDRKKTAGQGFCLDKEILFSRQGYCSLPGKPVFLHTSLTQFRGMNCIKCMPQTLHHKHLKRNLKRKQPFTPFSSHVSQTTLVSLMIHNYSPLLLNPPLQKGRGPPDHMQWKYHIPRSLGCQNKSGHNSLTEGSVGGCCFK